MPVRLARGALLASSLSVLMLFAGSARAADAPCASAYEQTQILRQGGKLVQARESARACARASCPEVVRKDCTAWGEQLERDVPSVVVIARDEATGDEGGVRVQIDGVWRPEASGGRAFELDPGAHAFHVERAGDEPLDQTITVVRGERDRALRFVLRSTHPRAPAVSATPAVALPTPAPVRESHGPSLLPAVVVGSVSVVAFGVSAWLGLTGRSDLSNLRTSCAPVCTDAQVDPVRRRLLVSDIALGAGLVGSAVTIYLFARAAGSHAGGEAHVDVASVPQGAALVLGGRF